jgi:osmotically-inducible protein OsmY
MKATTLQIGVALLFVVATSSVGDAQDDPAHTRADVATEIEQRFTADPQVNAQTIDVDVRGGVVTLTGRVNDADAKERAGSLAAGVRGVDSVRNQIAVSGGVRGGGAGPIPERMQLED